MIVLRALSALLSYPRDDLRHALPEIADAIRSSQLVAACERDGLMALIEELAAGDLLEAEERYVALFDRGRATSLHLFEHLHGESRDRGEAMVELKRLYERSGFELSTRELPDYLPVVLEYLSCCDLVEAREILSDCAHLLKVIASALMTRHSAYASVVQALLVIAGEAPLDTQSVPRALEGVENLDRDWFEEPAFGGPIPTTTAGRPAPNASR
jgi:nitrate reductase molybdenum cofactor assembly chaperone NarJ/NarW